MAMSLTPRDVHALMNELVKQATGQSDIDVIDTASFVAAGEKVLATGYENTLNALSLVIGRTIVAVRPYRARMRSIQAINTGEYTHRLRKISFYSRNALPAGNFNTQLYPANLAQGWTNRQNTTEGSEATKSQWLQNQPQVLQMDFSSQGVWQYSLTVYDYQLKQAFRSEDEFGRFVAGIMTEVGNDVESQREAFNRATLLNKIGAVYATGKAEQKVNLTAGFNAAFGTNYTSEQLRSEHLTEFLKYFVTVFKLLSDRMTERSAAYHDDMPKTTVNAETGETEELHILRHTPKSDQKAILYNPLFVAAQAQVLPAIFNPEYLNIDNFEGVDYWQSNYSEEVRPMVNVIPAVFDSDTGTTVAGDQVQIPYVVGMIFDRDAVLTDFQIDRVDTTVLESRKHYRNVWYTFSKGALVDPSENAVLLYMSDSEEGALSPDQVTFTGWSGDESYTLVQKSVVTQPDEGASTTFTGTLSNLDYLEVGYATEPGTYSVIQAPYNSSFSWWEADIASGVLIVIQERGSGVYGVTRMDDDETPITGDFVLEVRNTPRAS